MHTSTLRSLKDLSTLVLSRRRELSLTQAELATKAGIDTKQVSRLENGAHEPKLSTILSLLAALNVEILMQDRSDHLTTRKPANFDDLF